MSQLSLPSRSMFGENPVALWGVWLYLFSHWLAIVFHGAPVTLAHLIVLLLFCMILPAPALDSGWSGVIF